jgi:hypothetical protein
MQGSNPPMQQVAIKWHNTQVADLGVGVTHHGDEEVEQEDHRQRDEQEEMDFS